MDIFKELAKYDFSTGLPENLLRMLENEFKNTLEPLRFCEKAKSASPGVAELALEAGFYRLALNLNLDNPYDRARALMFLSEKDEVMALVQNIQNETIRDAIHMQLARMNGRANEAQLIFKNMKSKLPLVAEKDHAEILLQAGSVFFNSAHYSEAFEYYKEAFAKFELVGRKGKMAVAAFNACVAASHLGRGDQEKIWHCEANQILESYHLSHLRRSVELFSLEQLVDEREFERALAKATVYLANEKLSDIQKILALQAKAKILLELGQITEAEISAGQARHLIFSLQYFQYEIFQMALELNIEVLTHRRIMKGKSFNNPLRAADRRAILQYKMACARKASLAGDLPKLNKIFDDLKREPQFKKFQASAEDLTILTNPVSFTQSNGARIQEVQMMQALCRKNFSRLAHIVEHIDSLAEKNIWQRILMAIGRSFLSLKINDNRVANKHAEEALVLAQKTGLERLSTIALAICMHTDSRWRSQWLHHFNTLGAEDRAWIEKIFFDSLGISLVSTRWVLFKEDKKIFMNEQEIPADLVIDELNSTVKLHGNGLSLSGQTLLFKLLVAIASSQNRGLDKEELLERVWGYEYDPAVHDALVYTNIRRLREFVDIELNDGKYRIDSRVKWALISGEKSAVSRIELSERQKRILSFAGNRKSVFQRNTIVHELGFSARTALRELTDLVNKRILTKYGGGRSLKYALTNREVFS